MKIKDMLIYERPREKLEYFGKENISDIELLSIIIRSGTKDNSVTDISKEILNRIKNINNLKELNINSFNNIKGLGKVKIITLIAAIELGKRIYLSKNINNNVKMNDPSFIYKEFYYLFNNKNQELYYTFYLDNQYKLINYKLLFIGTINRTSVHPREIFKEAYLLSSSYIICIHNHPSGNLEPSIQDISFTKTLIEIGKLHGILLVDHLIFSNTGFYSFYKENNNLFN